LVVAVKLRVFLLAFGEESHQLCHIIQLVFPCPSSIPAYSKEIQI
jgi:hypothetical protein